MSEFFEYSKIVVTNFLQTVVIVDDEAFLRDECSPTREAPALIVPSGRRTETESPDGTPATEISDTTTKDEQLHQLDAKKLSDTFAEKGILCTALRPEDDEINTYKNVLKKADIVILDWRLKKGESNGETARSLIKEILQGEEGNAEKPLRSIVIYSGESNLHEKINLVKDSLQETLGDANQPNEFTLLYDNLQIKIYAKKATQKPPQDTEILKDEQELANVIIDDFTKQVSGLVPNMALQSLAELRKNTHKILGVFSKELDEAYLSHRALLPRPDDAEEFMIDLMVSEIQSILYDSNSKETLNLNQIKSWLKSSFNDYRYLRFFFNESCNLEDSDVQKKLITKFSLSEELNFTDTTQVKDRLIENKGILKDVLLKIFEKGLKKSKCILINQKTSDGKKEDLRYFTKRLYSSDEIAETQCNKFAILSSIKKNYESPCPYITLGTIIKDSQDNYFICIMPRCDAARIGSGTTSFPFLPLSDNDSNFEIITEHDGAYKTFKIEYKTKKLTLIKFKKTEGNNTQPLYAQQENEKLTFQDRDDKKYFWVAELKRDKAQAILNKFAATFSRVGYNESEFLRRSYQ